jgi:hypothetical protein
LAKHMATSVAMLHQFYVDVQTCEPAWNIDPLAGVIGVQY